MEEEEADRVSGAIIGCAIRLHQRLGPGLLESVYRDLLAGSIKREGFMVEREKYIDFEYDGVWFSRGFRVDILVDKLVVVEVKSITQLAPVHTKQLLTYLRLMDLRVGLLINFGAGTLREGLKRVVNG
jgi:iron complex transport system substrate-binding protein